MATVDELIERNKLQGDPAAAEPEGGLLSRIESFIGGSSKPDTLDATGLTQADRRQSLFAGLTDIGAKLMAAGEPMWGHQRAQYLAGLGSVPQTMQQMRSGIAQQKLLGIKGVQAQRELQVQREMDAIAKDPNHAIWKQFQGQDLALAQWAMRSGGPKAFMEFLAHKDDAGYKRAMAIKAQAEARKADAEAAGMTEANASTRALFGGGGTQPPVVAPPVVAPPAVPTTGQPSASVDPTDPATGLIGSPSAAAEGPAPVGPVPDAVAGGPTPTGPALTPPQQVLASNQPPSVQPTPAAGAILQGMQGAGSSEGPQVVEAPTATPVVPTPAPAVPGQPPARVFAPGYNGPRTLEEVARQLPPAEQRAIMGMWPPQKRIEALNNHIDRQVKLHELAQKAINDNVIMGPDGKPMVNQVAAEAQYKRDAAKAQAEADAQQTDRLRRQQEDQATTARMQAETAQRAQAGTATKEGLTTEGQFDPNKQAVIQEQKRQETAAKADIELRKELAQQDYKQYTDADKGSLAVAKGANKMLPLIYEAEEYRKSGMLTGAASEGRMWVSRMSQLLGLGEVSDAQINRVGYNNVVGRMMIEGLSSGRPLGSQVSDADREAMKELSGLDRNFTDKEIGRLMDIAERTTKRAFASHQETVTSLSRKHPALKDILAVDAEMKPVDRDTWTQQFRADQEQRRQSQNPLKKEF